MDDVQRPAAVCRAYSEGYFEDDPRIRAMCIAAEQFRLALKSAGPSHGVCGDGPTREILANLDAAELYDLGDRTVKLLTRVANVISRSNPECSDCFASRQFLGNCEGARFTYYCLGLERFAAIAHCLTHPSSSSGGAGSGHIEAGGD